MLDRSGFERACEDIFSAAGWGRVERIGRTAAGMDLLIHEGDGSLAIVECMHRPNASIGRPAVQDIYSAAMSEGASRGVIATTGMFTEGAKMYAAALSGAARVDLLDRCQLAELAGRAGIRLVAGGRDAPAQYLPDAGNDGALKAAMSRIAGLQSHPLSPAKISRVSNHAVHLAPYYLGRAMVERDFATTVGTIHSVSERGVPVLVDARSGSVCYPDTTAFLAGSPLEDEWAGGTDAGVQAVHKKFRYDIKAAGLEAAARLARRYTQRVSYRGRNNVKYTKTCEVSPRDIYFADFRQVLLPVHDVVIKILQSRYRCTVMHNGEEARVSAPDLERCGICEGGMRADAALCNACGAVHHPKRIFRGCGHRCKDCRKTVCRRCAFWTRRMLFLKRIMCGDCAAGVESAQRLR